MSMN